MKERPILFSAPMPMVRAILDGSKTQTRRIAKPRKHPSLLDGTWSDSYILDPGNRGWLMKDCPFGKVGDRLYVRETWRIGAWREDGRLAIDYAASPEITNTPWVTIPDDYCGKLFEAQWVGVCSELIKKGIRPDDDGNYHWDACKAPLKWRPSIHMPRWASRITLEITSVRIERLREISEADAECEGSEPIDFTSFSGREVELLDYPLTEYGDNYRNGFAFLWESIYGIGSWQANPWVWVVSFRMVQP